MDRLAHDWLRATRAIHGQKRKTAWFFPRVQMTEGAVLSSGGVQSDGVAVRIDDLGPPAVELLLGRSLEDHAMPLEFGTGFFEGLHLENATDALANALGIVGRVATRNRRSCRRAANRPASAAAAARPGRRPAGFGHFEAIGTHMRSDHFVGSWALGGDRMVSSAALGRKDEDREVAVPAAGLRGRPTPCWLHERRGQDG